MGRADELANELAKLENALGLSGADPVPQIAVNRGGDGGNWHHCPAVSGTVTALFHHSIEAVKFARFQLIYQLRLLGEAGVGRGCGQFEVDA